MPWPATLGIRRAYLHVPFFQTSNPKWWFVPLKMMWTSRMWHRVEAWQMETGGNFTHGKDHMFELYECTIASLFSLPRWWLAVDTGAIVVATIFSQWNDPASSSWWVSLTFGWCWALNELWIAHAVAFVRISITRCHPCRSKPRLVLFLLPLLHTVYFEWTRCIWISFVYKRFQWIPSWHLVQISQAKRYSFHYQIGICTTSTRTSVTDPARWLSTWN